MSLIKDVEREEAKADFFKYDCPDVTELVPAPIIRCECGYSGPSQLIMSYLKKARCPKCHVWSKYEE